jgi:hypothetical protein
MLPARSGHHAKCEEYDLGDELVIRKKRVDLGEHFAGLSVLELELECACSGSKGGGGNGPPCH